MDKNGVIELPGPTEKMIIDPVYLKKVIELSTDLRLALDIVISDKEVLKTLLEINRNAKLFNPRDIRMINELITQQDRFIQRIQYRLSTLGKAAENEASTERDD